MDKLTELTNKYNSPEATVELITELLDADIKIVERQMQEYVSFLADSVNWVRTDSMDRNIEHTFREYILKTIRLQGLELVKQDLEIGELLQQVKFPAPGTII